jgi:CubicO group peptidase (beta-lactamase class C family)
MVISFRARLLVACAAAASLALGGQDPSAGPGPSETRTPTTWLASADQASRVTRVEDAIPALDIEGAAPLRLTLRQLLEIYQIPGLSVAVFEAHALVWAKAYGVKERGGGEPVTLDTLFQAASISKPVTALAALHFVEKGRWTLDENVNDRLIAWKVTENEHTRVEKVTLRRLLSHTAGTTVHGFRGYATTEPVPTLLQVLNGAPPANSAPVRVDITPGTRERYSGGGTTIVQAMMVDQLRKPFPDIMRDTVLQPLGLAHSTYEQPLSPARARHAATGTRADGTSIAGRWHIYPEMAAAGLWTTPSDLARLAIEVSLASAGRSSRVLSRAMTRQMLTEQMPRVGLGFGLGPAPGQFRHNGANEGFRASLTAFADSGSGIAIMANSENGSRIFDLILASVAKEYGWPGSVARPLSPSATVDLLTRTRGVADALAWHARARARAGAQGFGPPVLNEAGYGLLSSGRTADAVTVFETNVALHPADANAYDSLAEAQMAAGLKDQSIANYRKSLELNPANSRAARVLERMGLTPAGASSAPSKPR